MPALADIAVLKNDGVTSVTYVAKNPAVGTDPALWRFDAHPAPYIGLKPDLWVKSRPNGPKTARRVEVLFNYRAYVTDTTTQVSSVLGTVPVQLSVLIPLGIPQADIDEAVSQGMNLFNSALIKSCFKTGFGPT